ncbi:NADPH-dependent FMN reductase [Streptomyces sp. NPDC001107]
MSTLPVILLLSGSLRVGSTNEAVLRTARAVAPSVPVEAVLYDGLAGLPHFNPDDDVDPLPEAVAGLRGGGDRWGGRGVGLHSGVRGDPAGGVQEPARLDGRRH